MKRCNNCGYKISDNSSYCIKCGAAAAKKTPFIISMSKALCYVLVWLAVQAAIVFIYCFTFIFSKLMNPSESVSLAQVISDASRAILVNINMLSLLSNALFIVLLMLFFASRKRNFFTEVKAASVPFKTLPMCAVLGFSTSIIVNTVIALIPWPDSFTENLHVQYAYTIFRDSIALQIMSICIMTGIVEEILFRGLIITRLRRSANRAVCVIISSAIFAAAHINPISMIYAFFIGLIFAVIFIRFDSILPSAICHMFFNLTSLFSLFLFDNLLLQFSVFFISCAIFIGILYLLIRKQSYNSNN